MGAGVDLDPSHRASLEDVLRQAIGGCPYATNSITCITTCGGNVPGAMITTENLVQSIARGTLVPEKIGCGIVQENAWRGYAIRTDYINQLLEEADVPTHAPTEITVFEAAEL